MKIFKTTSILLIGLSGLFEKTNAQSAYQNIRIDIQENNFEYAPCEPSIAVDPTNTNNLVAGAILNRVYVSHDAGKTWSESGLESTHGVYGDPCVLANSKGDFYYLHLGDPEGKGWGSERLLESIVTQRSKDKGATWSNGSSAGANAPKDQDKEWAIASPDSKRIYATWTQFDKYESKVPTDSSNILFSATNRKAKKWKKAVRINEIAGNCADDDGTVEGAVPAVGPNGEVYVAWAVNENIYFDRSFDKGKTWMKHDIVAADIPKGWSQDIPGIMRCNGMPILVCDNSTGPNRGALYICWADIRNGESDTDIWLVSSKDKGTTWTPPIKVNDDNPGRHQFFPWLAIDQANGQLHIVFYDRRNYTDDQTDVFLASSSDGGKTWINERISEKPFTPISHVFFGDYNNITAHNGIVRPIWTVYDDKKLSVWTAIINK
ncbi:MAG: glycosyl hydrolase [Flavobacteriales bacterium]